MSSPPFDFASWPPALTQPQLEALTLYATSYALSHGLLYLPPADRQPIVPSSAIHAPISLFPSPVPRKLFEQGQRIQRIYNVLYSRITMDDKFLDEIMGAETGVGKVDDFIGQLWRGWRKLRDEGHAPVRYPPFTWLDPYLIYLSERPITWDCSVQTISCTPCQINHWRSNRWNSIQYPFPLDVFPRRSTSCTGWFY
jgi:hypothetical protein